MSSTDLAGGDVSVVVTTAPDRATAERIVRHLVEERLVACGNVLEGMTSIYRWQGAVETTSELLVLLKTRRARVEEVFRRVGELHPYDVPELLALPAAAVSSAYSRWVRAETTEVIV
jgi:periplasmic divalent cation tolerance protein